MACFQLLKREMGRVLEEHGMLLSGYRALGVLQAGPATMGQVAQKLGLTPATLTTLARGLERGGWVVRVRSPTDRRAFLLEATPEGRRVVQRSRQIYRRHLRAFEASLRPGTKVRLGSSLQDLRRVLEQAELESRADSEDR